MMQLSSCAANLRNRIERDVEQRRWTIELAGAIPIYMVFFVISSITTVRLALGKLSSVLCLFLSAKDVEAFLGDLVDKHALIAKRNEAEADRWFRRELRRSFPPLVWAQFKRSSGVNKLVEWYRKIRS